MDGTYQVLARIFCTVAKHYFQCSQWLACPVEANLAKQAALDWIPRLLIQLHGDGTTINAFAALLAGRGKRSAIFGSI